MSRPSGGFAEEMLQPGGWPDVDEDTFYSRAQEYTRVLRQATEVLETWGQQRSQVFGGGLWTGGAANAADGKLGAHMDQLVTLQNAITTVVTWHNHIGESIAAAKSVISDNLEGAHQQITAVLNDRSLEADEQKAAIETVIKAAHGANVSVVTSAADRIRSTRGWTPPKNALEELLDQKIPPPVVPSDTAPEYTKPGADTPNGQQPPPATPATPTPVPGTPRAKPAPGVPDTPAREPQPEDTPDTAPPAPEKPDTEAPATPVTPVSPIVIPSLPSWQPSQPGAGVVRPTPGSTPKPGTSNPPGTTPPSELEPDVTPAPGTDVEPEAEPDVAAAVEPGVAPVVEPDIGPAAPAGPAPASPAASGPDTQHRGMAAASTMSATAQPVPSVVRSDDSSPAVAPAASTGAAGSAGASAAGSRGASAGPRASSAAPVKPLGPASAPRGASGPAKAPAAQAARPEAKPEPPDRADAVALAAVPVSAARAARDAAAASDAARRQSSRDSLRLARRVAAALNAPDNNGEGDTGFFWVTAITTDDAIVVANSYGVAYIPDGVLLPEPVQMATADHTIPPAERVRWSTYPIAAVQGWAARHDQTLRAVIATEEQIAGTDSGAATVLLKPEDIPASGAMAGRSRLEVVHPEAAQRLAAADDARLIDLLPPAPADALPLRDTDTDAEPITAEDAARISEMLSGQGDLGDLLQVLNSQSGATGPPADQRPSLWFDVIKPMTTNASGRDAAHLRAFHTYAAYARDHAVKDAHAAVEMDAKRAAAADWMYWQHVAALIDAASTGAR